MRPNVYETVFQVKAHRETLELFNKLRIKMAGERGELVSRATVLETLVDRIAKQEQIAL